MKVRLSVLVLAKRPPSTPDLRRMCLGVDDAPTAGESSRGTRTVPIRANRGRTGEDGPMPKRAISSVTAVALAAAGGAPALMLARDPALVPLPAFLLVTGALILLVTTSDLPLTQESPVGPGMVSILL